jgi:hypothetical protein
MFFPDVSQMLFVTFLKNTALTKYRPNVIPATSQLIPATPQSTTRPNFAPQHLKNPK